MVRCDRCDGYASRDYARVFGDNQDLVSSCPNCRTGWENKEDQPDDETDRRLRFRMSDFESEESDDETASEPASAWTGRFGRVGKRVSGLF